MRCAKCGGEVTAAIPMKNIDGAKGRCYFCNQCHNSFWKSMDGTIIDSQKEVVILGAYMSKGEAKACNYDISIDLISFGIDTATKDGKKIANDIADYLRDFGYNVSVNNDDHHASLIINLSATEDQNKGGRGWTGWVGSKETEISPRAYGGFIQEKRKRGKRR